MNRYEPTKRFFAISILAAVSSVAVVALFSSVLISKLSKIEQEVQKTTRMNVSVEQAYKIKGQLNELAPQLRALDSFFVGSGQEVGFIESIEKLASTTGVELSIQSISIDSKDKQSFKEDMSVDLQAEGSRAQLMSFLRALDSLPKAIYIDRAELGSNESDWVLRVKLLTYRLK